MLNTMVKELIAVGHEVLVYATVMPEAPVHYEYEGVEVIVTNIIYARQNILTWKPDVIISHHDNTIRANNIAKKLKIPLVFICHNDMWGIDQVLDQNPEFVVFNSQWLKEKLERPGMRSMIMHPPVFAEQHRTSPGTKVTLVNLNSDKGSGILYELARRQPDMQFLAVVGGHGTQIYPPKDLTNIEVVEHSDDMKTNVWSKTRVLLMPSVYESYGMAGVEAMASGIPVICAPTPGLLESQGEAGIFIDRNDIDWWEHNVLMLMSNQIEWETASRRALKRSAELDPRIELAHWVSEIERLVRDSQTSKP